MRITWKGKEEREEGEEGMERRVKREVETEKKWRGGVKKMSRKSFRK